MTNIQAIDLLKGLEQSLDDYCELNDEGKTAFHMAITALEVFGNSEQLPSAQPEPISDVYMKAVWTWLLDYQIKAAELKGRYTPYEVLSWVANDWRKEHEGFDRKAKDD